MRQLLLFLTAALALPAQEARDPKARDPAVVRYREFAEIVGEIAQDVEKADKALVVWLVDNATMLKASKHGELLSDALPRFFTKPKVFHAVIAFGETPRLVQKPVEDATRAAAAIASLAAAPPDDAVKNLCQALREASKLAAGFSGGKKFLVLFTQENADSEDDVEGTLKTLKGTGVAFHAVVPETVYSDPYWESTLSGTTYFFDPERFRKLPFKLKGPESAFLEFPYGFPFTWVDPGYTVPSGFPPYAVDRLATHSGGKTYLYSIERAPQSFCQRYACPLCGGGHKACGAAFDVTKLGLTAPSIASRPEYGARYGKDKAYLATVGAWDRLHRAGILRGAPPLKASGGGLAENVRSEKESAGSRFSRMVGDWKAQRIDALKQAEAVEKVAGELAETVRKNEKDADLRSTATAEALLAHLKLLEQACRQFGHFCEEMERQARARALPSSDGVAATELRSPTGEKVIGYYYQSYSLCHGGAALRDIRFLGDLKELHAAFDAVDALIEKHRGTPWELLIRRGTVPVFTPIFEVKVEPGAGGAAERPKPRSSSSGQAATETPGANARPSRPVTADPGRSGGTTTPGGSR